MNRERIQSILDSGDADRIKALIEPLEENKRGILYARFAEGLGWEQVGEKCYYSHKAAQYIARNAIEELESLSIF